MLPSCGRPRAPEYSRSGMRLHSNAAAADVGALASRGSAGGRELEDNGSVPNPSRTQAVERCLVLVVALHAIGVGAMLLLAPAWSCRVLGGWTALGPLFFPRQSGIFHFILAYAYLWEYFRLRTVTIMVVAKTVAVVFLLACTALDGVPWVVPFSGVTDGMMGVTILLVHRAVARSAAGCRSIPGLTAW